jgi:hypothetical protein
MDIDQRSIFRENRIGEEKKRRQVRNGYAASRRANP